MGVGDGLGQASAGQVQTPELKEAKREVWLGVRKGVLSPESPIKVRWRPLMAGSLLPPPVITWWALYLPHPPMSHCRFPEHLRFSA